jgi:3-oxoacyl-[acyl-carrier protein] reductase
VTTIVLDPAEALSEVLGDVVVIEFSSDADEMMWQALVALQAAYRSGDRRTVLVVPTIGMAGAAGSVAYTTAVEGIRAMAKSAARQWGSQGVGVNMIAAPAHLFTHDVDASHLSAAAVDDGGGLIRTVVETAKFLLRDDLPHLNGETVIVDGGQVMLP